MEKAYLYRLVSPAVATLAHWHSKAASPSEVMLADTQRAKLDGIAKARQVEGEMVVGGDLHDPMLANRVRALPEKKRRKQGKPNRGRPFLPRQGTMMPHRQGNTTTQNR